MAEVFTSYSRRDTDIVDKVVATVEQQTGLDIWLDREDIKAGNTWRVQIVRAIDECHAFVLMLSPNSAASDNVRKEIDLAQDSQRTIFPLMLDPVKLPPEIRYQLAGLQFIDVKMVGYEKAVEQLIEVLKEHIKKTKPPEATKQVELVIQGIDVSQFDAAKQAQLLDFLAQLSNANRDQLKIEKVSAGSVHAFVSMPSAAAYELKTLALNRDRRFSQLGIVALKLDSNKNYLNIASGKLTPMATVGPLMLLWWKLPGLFTSVLGATGGKLLTLAAIIAVATGIGLAAPNLAAPAPPTALPPTEVLPAASTLTSLPAPVSTETPLPTIPASETPTATLTETPLPTATETPTAVAYQHLTGTVAVDFLTCRYGPGQPYLFYQALASGLEIEFYGRMEIQSLGQASTWLYGRPDGYDKDCWVNARSINLDGDISSLEPDYYPGKALEYLFNTNPNFQPPSDVHASRQGDTVTISWTGMILAPGDREEPDRPIYLVEAWTCQGGEIVFTPLGYTATQPMITEPIRDEAGCSEPSHARVFLAHKDGYVGPSEVPAWPLHP